MTHTYSKVLIHVVWSTKERRSLIIPSLKNRLYAYIQKVVEDEKEKLFIMNGMPDHVHLLLTLSPQKQLSDLVKQIKIASTKWTRTTFTDQKGFSWQEGYGAFSVGYSGFNNVVRYIENQEEHHKKMSFEEEFLNFLSQQEISYDSRFVLG